MQNKNGKEPEVDIEVGVNKGKVSVITKGPGAVILLICCIAGLTAVVYIASTTANAIALGAMPILAFAIGYLLPEVRNRGSR